MRHGRKLSYIFMDMSVYNLTSACNGTKGVASTEHGSPVVSSFADHDATVCQLAKI